ncbi:hypothetical protein ACOMHN_000603 [Nucella lapillus]
MDSGWRQKYDREWTVGGDGNKAGNRVGGDGKKAGNGVGGDGNKAGNGVGGDGKKAGNGVGGDGKKAGNGITSAMTTTLPAANDGRTTPASLQQNGHPEPEPETTEPEQEVVLEGEELFMVMSSEEEEEWRKRMEEMETNLQTRRDNFHRWHDGFTRRRMFAYSRLRKLQQVGRQRGVFLDDISAYIASVKPKVKKDSKKNLKESQKTASQGKDTTVSRDSQQQQRKLDETAADTETVTVKPLLRSSE